VADYVWTGAAGDGSVANPANWQVNGQVATVPPGAGDTAFFTSSAGSLFGVDTVGGLQFQNAGPWSIGGTITSTGSIVAPIAPLTVLGGGTLVSGSLIDAANGFTVANGGSVTAQLLTTAVFTGQAATPDLNLQNGAQVTLTGFGSGTTLPEALDVTNTGTIDRATVSASGGYAVVSGTAAGGAILTVQDGAVVTALSTFVGARSGETGTLRLTGTNTSWSDVANATIAQNTGSATGLMIVGGAGATGHLTIVAGASLTDGGFASIGDGAGGTGDATVSQGGSWSVGNVLEVGNAGTGTLAVSAGGKVTSGASGNTIAGAGISGGSHGTITVDGAGSYWTSAAQTVIGSLGTGNLSITNGGSVGVTGGILVIGQTGTGTGSVDVDGAGSMLTNAHNIDVGFGGSGTLTVANGGSVVDAGAVYVGYSAGASGTLTIGAGSTLRTTLAAQTGNITFGVGINAASGGAAAGTGSITVQGTGALLDTNGNPFTVGLQGNGTLTVGAGGTVRAGTVNGLVAAALDLGGQAGGVGTLSVLAGGTVTLSGRSVIGDSGQGSASVAGTLTDTGTLQIGTRGQGSLAVAGTLTAAELDLGTGVGSTGTVDVSGGVTLTGAWLLGEQGTGIGTVESTGIVTASLLAVGATGTLTLAGGAVHAPGTITIAAGGSASGAGMLDGPLLNNGTVLASLAGQTLSVTGAATGSGTMKIADGATLAVAGAVAAQQHVTLGATGATLVLGDAGGFAGTIDGFVQGDTIALLNADIGSASVSGSTLDLFNHMGAQVAALGFATAAQAMAAIVPTGTGTIDITAGMPCFAAGTRIATERGPVPVEHLRAGDRALLAGGGARPIVWIGHRTVEIARHPRPETVRPVRIRRDAFGPGRPASDLLLSPDHAIHAAEERVLIPVRHLIDGEAIAPIARARVRYFHIELDRHDVILAEGLPVESYLETGGRAAFENGGAAVALHPDFAARHWEAEGCAPLHVTGPAVEAVRQRVAAAAAVSPAPRGAVARSGGSICP
jgi:T5SS/PEP-CTERM-associated repeat protein